MAHGVVVVTVFAFLGICTFSPVTGLIRLCVAVLPPLPLLSLPLKDGGGLSSLDFRFSARGGRNAVGDVDGVLLLVLLPELLDEFELTVTVEFVVTVGAPVVADVRAARALALAFRSLLCTCMREKINYPLFCDPNIIPLRCTYCTYMHALRK